MTVQIIHGDCLDVMRGMADASVDSVVTDPPYGLGFMGKKWDSPGSFVERKAETRNTFDHVGGNHNPTCSADSARTRLVEGRKFQRFCEQWAVECFRVLKPGGHLAAFGGSRTYHRMACAIEDAGFEIRDQIMWLYGSGFPKSQNVGKAFDKAAGAEREVVGPAVYGDGHIQNSAESIGYGGCDPAVDRRLLTAPATDLAKQWDGWGTALKPAHEPICLARKPLSERTVAANVAAHGTGAINIDGCRVETGENLNGGAYAEVGRRSVSGSLRQGGGMNQPGKTTGREYEQPAGRWPANVCHDGSDEVLEAFARFGEKTSGKAEIGLTGGSNQFFAGQKNMVTSCFADTGTAARFFFCAKASREERGGSRHPTIKPLSLMQWLVRLITPPGGTVLDPFAGSGSTGVAADREGFNAILIEREAEYIADIHRRVAGDAGMFAELTACA